MVPHAELLLPNHPTSHGALHRAGNDAGDYVVLVGLSDLCLVEAAGFEGRDAWPEFGEVVDVDFAVDFWSVELGAAFP